MLHFRTNKQCDEMPSRQGKAADGERKTRVAIIGTGLAGLTTAYLLHRDSQKRYDVTLFEQVSIDP